MVMPTGLAVHSIETSNIPPKQKSALLRMVDNLTGGAVEKFQEKAENQTLVHRGHVHSLGHLLRQDTEAGLAGMIAGVADAELESDMAPLVMAAVGAAGTIMCSGSWAESTFRNVSSTGVGIFGYVKMKELFATKKTLGAHGETTQDEDPIIAFGKTL
jgi:hypothetical protein